LQPALTKEGKFMEIFAIVVFGFAVLMVSCFSNYRCAESLL